MVEVLIFLGQDQRDGGLVEPPVVCLLESVDAGYVGRSWLLAVVPGPNGFSLDLRDADATLFGRATHGLVILRSRG